jgi:hypothetical protein
MSMQPGEAYFTLAWLASTTQGAPYHQLERIARELHIKPAFSVNLLEHYDTAAMKAILNRVDAERAQGKR